MFEHSAKIGPYNVSLLIWEIPTNQLSAYTPAYNILRRILHILNQLSIFSEKSFLLQLLCLSEINHKKNRLMSKKDVRFVEVSYESSH